MKASDILQQYQNGQRNFQRLNLRGLNFAEKNLSGADFSHCDIKGANFRKANLMGVNFTGVKAGLQLKNKILQGFLLCFLAAFSQYFLFQVFKLDTLPTSGRGQIVSIILITFVLAFHSWFSIKNSLSEKLSIVVGAYTFLGTVATALALINIRFINLEIYITLGAMTLFITVISAICTGIFWVLCENWLIYLLPIIFAIDGFLEGYTRSNENQLSMVVGIVVSVVGWISGIYISKRGLKEDERHKWVRPIVLFIAFLIGGTNFFEATLTDANFTSATLKNTNFNKAILTRTCFKDTVKLNLARAGKTILANPTVRDLLITPSSGCGIDLYKADLRGANLESANLEKANLKQADISEATLQNANLKDANLTEVNAISTNFDHVLLTGACLEAWNIDPNTNLENVECDYIFLLENPNHKGNRERRPHDPDAIFKEGDFTRLYQKALNTLQLFLRDGMNPQAFREAFDKIIEDNPEITYDSIQSVEKKGKDVLVTVEVPPDKDKGQLEKQFNQTYYNQDQLNAATAQAKLEAYEDYRTDLKEIIQNLRPQPNANINLPNAQFGGGFAGGDYSGDVENIMNQLSESKDKKELKNLLQQLIDKLEQDNEKSS
jgi:uncharacterized protein YjbI with pentapeptide repeats/uncharacterized protein YneF (UPF0154 family)